MANRRAQSSRESRRMLVAAATELFAENGFRRTTFADIADRSGVSRGSIPWHFGNKDGLLQAVIEEMTASMPDIGRSVRNLDEGMDRVRDFVRRPTTRLLITLVAEAVEPDSPVHTYYTQLHGNLRQWIDGWVDESALPAGVRREDFVAVMTGAIIGVHQQWRIAPDSVDLDRCIIALKAFAVRRADTA